MEPSKSHFIVINGEDNDTQPLVTDHGSISNSNHISLLGSHLSASGLISDDLKLHYDSRFKAAIKYYNFLRSNRNAPMFIRLKVLKSCVLSNILYNCETFGRDIPKDLEKCYLSLIKSCLGIRRNTPSHLVLIESGFLSLEAVVYGRQLNFFRKFKKTLKPQSTRYLLFNKLLESNSSYLEHYVYLDQKYNSKNEIYLEYISKVKDEIRTYAAADNHYKYKIYLEMNANLVPSRFLYDFRPIALKITKFRLGSHNLPIEKGRWSRQPRQERFCASCNELGDEYHLIYSCRVINRSGLNLPNDLTSFWNTDDAVELIRRIDADTDLI